MRYHKITGEIEVLTGLHIGCKVDSAKIGSFDNAVVRMKKFIDDMEVDIPYIPGSSLKGKMRYLIEKNLGLLHFRDPSQPYVGLPTIIKNARPKSFHESLIVNLFGTPEERWQFGPTRLLFRDSLINANQERKFITGEFRTEIKTEAAIQRDTGHSYQPRPIERVPAGIKFDMEMILRTIDEKDEGNLEKYIELIKLGLYLIELDYIGGGGSRGSGKVRFNNIKIDDKEISIKEEIKLSEIKRERYEVIPNSK
ncbi:MAG: type III-A CRISPR-associated RAMP protein Csm3 [Candidatus Zixiibacteriota bacterium]